MFAAIGCSRPKDIEFKSLKNFKLNNIKKGSVQASLDVIMFNPNAIQLQLKNSYFDLYFNDKLVGNSNQNESIVIPKSAEFNIPVTIDVDPKNLDILSNTLDIIQGKKMKIKMKGYCTIKKLGITVKIPIEHEQEQQIKLF
jgi:LEA14-like dessication related protein